MLDFLMAQGKVVVAGRTGAVRWWADAATWWPAGTPRRLIRERIEELFGFRYRLELYTPKAKRRCGYLVMPVLIGDRLIGRIDPAYDRRTGHPVVHAAHAEPDAARRPAMGRAVADVVAGLAAFVGASDIRYGGPVPPAWRRALS